jgi:hypothetical protein
MPEVTSSSLARFDSKLEAFVREHHGRVSRWELRHLVTGGGEHRVRELRPIEGEAPDAVTARVWALAIDDARGLSEYALLAYEGDAANYVGRQKFRVQGGADDDLEPTEPPTMQGVMAQHMRHTEASVRIATLASGDLLRLYRDENRELRAHIRSLEKTQLRTYELCEDLTSRRAERDLSVRREERADARQAHVVGQLSKYLPMLVDRVLGATGLVKDGESPATDAARIANVVRGLDESKLSAILEIVGPEGGRELLSVIGGIVAREEAAAAAGGKTNGTTTTGGAPS